MRAVSSVWIIRWQVTPHQYPVVLPNPKEVETCPRHGWIRWDDQNLKRATQRLQ
jgi:hypothetical protein